MGGRKHRVRDQNVNRPNIRPAEGSYVMPSGIGIVAIVAAVAAGQSPRLRRRRGASKPGRPSWGSWWADPRSGVLAVVTASIAIGGGLKLLQWWRAREALDRLGAADVTEADVDDASRHGRAVIMDLFRIMGTADREPLRAAAGRSLARLWAEDNLIAEEEKALVVRGFAASWQARRRYPRALRAPIPIAITYGVPFLQDDDGPISPRNLEWSHRVLGTRRAEPEIFTPWKPGPARAEFTLVPGDFETDGPHRLVLHARVRTAGLTDHWEVELPQMTSSLEFDSRLLPEALLTLADEARGEAIARSVCLKTRPATESQPPTFAPLNDAFAIRDLPELTVATPLPCDLAHAAALEFEGVAGRFDAGSVVLSGQGDVGAIPAAATAERFPLGPIAPLPADAIDRPGPRRMRAVLTADPDRGWADPDVRSIWPGTIETEWVEVQVVRR